LIGILGILMSHVKRILLHLQIRYLNAQRVMQIVATPLRVQISSPTAPKKLVQRN